MSIASIMTRRVVTVHMDDSLATVKSIFEASQFHHLLVVEHQKLVGVVSDRDLLKAVSPFLDTLSEKGRDRATLDRKVHQIMSRELIVLHEHNSIVEAIECFNRHNISCLPVVTSDNKPVGIISWRDILAYVEDRIDERRVSNSATPAND